MQNTLLSIGSSTLSWAEFTARLEQYEIGCLIDVRSFPRSRRPCFNQSALQSGLNRRGISYLHLGFQLGGYVSDAEASYTRRSTLPAFREGIAQVCDIAERCRPALFCAEGDVLDCHRFVILSRFLAKTSDLDIKHVLRNGRIETHAEAEDRLLRKMGLTPDLFSDRSERLEAAYTARLIRMGLRP